MSIDARLTKLERQQPPSTPEADEDREWWNKFRDFVFEVLARGGHDDALAHLRERIAAAEGYTNWGARSVTGANTGLWVVSQTMWGVLDGFPPAKKLVEDVLEEVKRRAREEPSDGNRRATPEVPSADADSDSI